MADRALVVVTHGEFGIQIVKSAEMIMGEQEDVSALALRPGDSVDDLRVDASAVVDKYKEAGKEVIILCDLLGGSPSNVALYLAAKHDVKIFTGINLPMLIEILQGYKFEEDTAALLARVEKTAIEGIRLLDRDFLKNR